MRSRGEEERDGGAGRGWWWKEGGREGITRASENMGTELLLWSG